jgi:hypothetical protein
MAGAVVGEPAGSSFQNRYRWGEKSGRPQNLRPRSLQRRAFKILPLSAPSPRSRLDRPAIDSGTSVVSPALLLSHPARKGRRAHGRVSYGLIAAG